MEINGTQLAFYAPLVDRRAEIQAARLARGVEKGRISEEEAAQITAQTESVAALKEEYASDGYITIEERFGLHENLLAPSESIYHASLPASSVVDVTA